LARNGGVRKPFFHKGLPKPRYPVQKRRAPFRRKPQQATRGALHPQRAANLRPCSTVAGPHVAHAVQFQGDPMATRPEIKVKKSEAEIEAPPSQKVKKETGAYRLQVDRQTKASFETEQAAMTAGLVIKKGYPVVQVSIYNSTDGTNKLVELPK
jgi:hypothetical protein